MHGRDAILRVRDKLLVFNMILQLWADVKYHVPTGFFAVKRRAVFILGAKWIVLERGWRRDCAVGDMETRFQ